MADPLFPDATRGRLPASPRCPFCRRRDTKVLSAFGGQLSVAQCWCNRCRTAFEYLKWGDEAGSKKRGRAGLGGA